MQLKRQGEFKEDAEFVDLMNSPTNFEDFSSDDDVLEGKNSDQNESLEPETHTSKQPKLRLGHHKKQK